ncbi:hypothetical protein GOP47_0018093 [Adiantum capillus-veneris]|uniref:Uncharacterized protein n=1 Tax=Adiantum capillus-veneris TaxID=13818 RepID=A0A9D4UGQ1_ADICA|nr:hypothetical protein GOP47_0018093 [Adiantum capillus-veneris]
MDSSLISAGGNRNGAEIKNSLLLFRSHMHGSSMIGVRKQCIGSGPFLRHLQLAGTTRCRGHPIRVSDQSGEFQETAASPGAVPLTETNKFLEALQNANKLIPYVVLGSTLTALVYPPSFSWFTNRYYTPALGFLMFAVGINLKYSDFTSAFKRPSVLAVGYIGQYVVKPLLGVLFATVAVSYLHLPDAIGTGLILVSCVSGAQLSNYATFLVNPSMAPLSIVMTALSTATAVFVIPALTHLLLGQRLPVDARSMMVDITQIVVAPIAAGLALKQFAPRVTKLVKPLLPLLSVMVTGLCMGSPLSRNISAVKSPFGLELLLPIIGFHAAAFLIGHKFSGLLFWRESDRKGLQRTISLETGMQSSLLGLALANKYFSDPLVGLPSAMSTVLMSLMGFGLVMYWNAKKERNMQI